MFCLLQLYPFRIPDFYGNPLIVSGRYQGTFPDIVKARGFIADMSSYKIDVKVRKTKGIPLDRVNILIRTPKGIYVFYMYKKNLSCRVY